MEGVFLKNNVTIAGTAGKKFGFLRANKKT